MAKMNMAEGSAAEEAMDAKEQGGGKVYTKPVAKKKPRPMPGKVAPAAFMRAAKNAS